MIREFDEFVKQAQLDYSIKRVSETELDRICAENEMQVGDQTKHYLLSYGFLTKGSIEFYGINSIQGPDSDMVKQTKYLHRYFHDTEGLIAFEGLGEGSYILVDKDDNMFELDSELSTKVKSVDKKLFEYIKCRF